MDPALDHLNGFGDAASSSSAAGVRWVSQQPAVDPYMLQAAQHMSSAMHAAAHSYASKQSVPPMSSMMMPQQYQQHQQHQQQHQFLHSHQLQQYGGGGMSVYGTRLNHHDI